MLLSLIKIIFCLLLQYHISSLAVNIIDSINRTLDAFPILTVEVIDKIYNLECFFEDIIRVYCFDIYISNDQDLQF